jgi:hypothetical protein
MRFTNHVRAGVGDKLAALAKQMSDWEATPLIDEDSRRKIHEAITFFGHCDSPRQFSIAGVDGSGDFPALSYSDSFVYITVAHGTNYRVVPGPTLRELDTADPIIEFTWMPESADRLRAAWDGAFENLSGYSMESVVERSDYRILDAVLSGSHKSVQDHIEDMLRPHASDAGNISIQLRTTAELGTALRLIESTDAPNFVLVDTTMSLPMVGRKNASLFYEHLKRLCCVEARNRGIGFFAISKSHGLPSIEQLDQIAKDKQSANELPGHWFLRIPTETHDGWKLPLLRDRPVPPVGAISYLVRFHTRVPVLRIDMDIEYWKKYVLSESEYQTRENEIAILRDLDFSGHEQRSYGYPYPLKAGHDRASLTDAERVAFKKWIVDAAVEAGIPRSVFRDVSFATGHR